MKTAILAAPGRLESGQAPDPEIEKDHDVIVRIKAVGVCGSDMHYFTTGRIGSQIVKYPFIVGHESAGVVEKVGKGVTRVKPGQKVAIEPAVSCGKCDQCKAGRENTCRELRFLGAPGQMEGAMREFVKMPEENCFPLKETTTFEQGALSEPLAIGVYAVERSGIADGANVAILGVGPIGMSVFHTLRTMNVGNVYVTDRIEAREEFAKSLKPAWTGNPDRDEVVKEISRLEPLMMDAVFECSGDPEAIRQAVELMKPGGNLMIVGIPEVDDITLPVHELRRKEITIINVRRQNHCTQKAIDFLEQGKIKMDSLVTHRYSLDDAGKAFELVANQREGVMKAMIVID